MTVASDPVLDPARLAALADTGILDTTPEQAFDDVVRLASRLCDAPTALVSLVDRDRQWFKAKVGFDQPQTDLQSSVCRHGLTANDVIVFPDLTHDARTRDNPLVTGGPQIRFYAGAPLRLSDGHVAGVLCVIDTAPRPDGLTEDQTEDLRALARQIVDLLEVRRDLRDTRRSRTDAAVAARFAAALVRLGDALRELDAPEQIIPCASQIVGETLGAERAGFAVLDWSDNAVRITDDWTAEGVASIAGVQPISAYGAFLDDVLRGEAMLIPDVRTDARTADTAPQLEALDSRAIVNVPLMQGGRLSAIQFAHFRQPVTLTDATVAFMQNVADRTSAGIARLVAEQRQRMLNDEIGHRLRNMLSMVQAVAAQTLREVENREAVAALDARLKAMSTAQDVLFQNDWQPSDLGALVDRVLTAAGVRDRCDTSGPAVRLSPRVTLAGSLLLHELATNAVKHGSLSSDEGRVALTWSVDADTLRLDWRESGGPPVTTPTRRGLGSRLMRTGLGAGGAVSTDFNPEGLHARFDLPLSLALAD